MQSAILFFCFIFGASASREEVTGYTFEDFKKDFGRTYQQGDGEHEMRQAIFTQRVAEVEAHNARDLSWKLAINHLSDRTPEELKQLNGYKRELSSSPDDSTRSSSIISSSSSFLQVIGGGNESGRACSSHEQKCAGVNTPCCDGLVCGSTGICLQQKSPPPSIDWSDLPTAMVVPNQGACGSCWAVAATAAIQLQAVINTKGHFSEILSPQNILSCTPNEFECGGQGGCQGATAELGFDWLKGMGLAGGVHTVRQQEYIATATKSNCPRHQAKVSLSSQSFLQTRLAPEESLGPAISITGWKKLQENSAEDMMRHLVSVGPLVASVVGDGLHSYSRGVKPGCDDFVIDHAVLMMGYGDDKDRDMMYWKIRNSWGSGWGENGFFRLQRFYPQKDEPYGVDTDPSKGVACKDKATGKYPESSVIYGACGILADTAYPVGTSVPRELLSSAETPGDEGWTQQGPVM